jgi:hypothetical protein
MTYFSKKDRRFSGWELCAALAHISNNSTGTVDVVGAIPGLTGIPDSCLEKL